MIFEQVLAGEEFGVSDAKSQPLLAPHPVPPRCLPPGRRTCVVVMNYDSTSKSLYKQWCSHLYNPPLFCAVHGQFGLIFAVATSLIKNCKCHVFSPLFHQATNFQRDKYISVKTRFSISDVLPTAATF